MACKIKYNGNGTISTVINEKGNPDPLFTALSKIPVIESKEKALDIFIQTSNFEGDLNLQYRVGDKIFNNYKEALEENSEISIGVYESINSNPQENSISLDSLDLNNPDVVQHLNITYGSIEKYKEALEKIEKGVRGFILRDNRGQDIVYPRTVLETFTESLGVNFEGLKAETPADIADLMALHRSPLIEKGHIAFVKKGKIVSVRSSTIGLSGATRIPLSTSETKKTLKSLGADGYYLIHNHPSSNITPSKGDIKTTENFINSVEGFKGHVILNTNKFSLIKENLEVDELPYKSEKQPLRLSNYSIGEGKEAAENLGNLSMQLLGREEDTIVVVFLNTQLTVVAFESFPSDITKKQLSKAINNIAKTQGASQVALSTINGDTISIYTETGISLIDSFNFSDKNSSVNYTFVTSQNVGEIKEFPIQEEQSNFKSLLKVNPTKDPRTRVGFINKSISDGILKDELHEYNGELYLRPEGRDFMEEQISAITLQDDLRFHVGSGNYKETEGLFKLTPEKQITDTVADQITKDVASAVLPNKEQAINAPREIDEDSLKLRLLDVLAKMGVERLSISDYLQRFSNKGLSPSVQGLADIANNIIAVKDSNDISTLAEETMHFLVASLPEATLQRLYTNIENTKEYKDNEDIYRKAYTKQGRTASQTEQMVKEEVLGKIFKNALLESTQQETTPVSFYRRAVTSISDFFSSLFDSNVYNKELLEINKIVNQYILNKDTADFSKLEKAEREDRILYSLTGASGNEVLDSFRANLSKVTVNLEKTFKSLKGGSNFKISDLRKLTVDMDALGQAQAASGYIAMVNRLTNHVTNSLTKAEQENRMLSSRDRNAFENLKTAVQNDLARLKEAITNKDIDQIGLKSKKEKDFILSEIDSQLEKISRIQPAFDNLRNKVFDNLSERLTDKYNFPPYYKEFLRKSLEGNDNELSVFMRYVGQMDSTSNAYLLMAQSVIEEMDSKRRDDSFEAQNKFRKVIDDLGLNGKDLDALITEDGYLQSKWDFGAHKKDVDQVSLDVAIEMGLVEKGTSLEEFDKKRKAGDVDIYSDTKYFIAVNEKMLAKGINVRPSTEKYYADREKQLEEAGADTDTITFLKGLSYARGSVYRKHTDKNGLINLTPQAKNTIKLITKERASAKSLYDEISELKEGIEQVPNPTENSIEVKGLNYILKNNASIPAKRAFVMQKLDISFRKEKDKSTEAGTEIFETDASKLENHLEGLSDEEFVNFLANNVGIRFTSKFYDGKGIDVSDTKDPQVIKVLELRSQISFFYSKYRDTFNPAEIMGNEMTTNDMNILKEIHKRLSDESRVLAKRQNVEYDFGSSETQINNAYSLYLEQKGILQYTNAEVEIIIDNVSNNLSGTLLSTWKDIQAFEKTGVKSPILVKYMRENNITEDDTIVIDFVNNSRSKMYPYFKRSVPIGFDSFESINNDTVLTTSQKADLMKDQFKKYKLDSDLYEFTVNYDFKKNKDLTNPEYDKNFVGGAYQPSLTYGNGKYKNKKYFELFGTYDKTPTKNHKLFEALNAIVASKTDAHERMDISSMSNVYLLPQVRRTKTERLASVGKIGVLKTVKETLVDTVSNNIDEKEFGQKENGDGLHQIPQFFVTPLEDQKIVSKDIYSSLVQMIDQSVLYDVRKNKYSDITAIQEKMLESYGSSAKADKSNSYIMLRNKIDSQFFGVNETMKKEISLGHLGTIDVATTGRMLQKFVRFKNLAGFFIIPITSYITGEVALKVESLTGQYVSKDSLSLASTQATQMLKGYMTPDNTFGFDNKSKLHKLLNSFGYDDSVERARNAKFGKSARTMGKFSMFMHKAANLPIVPRTVLANIFDTRIINKKIVSREDFSKQKRREGISQKEIDKEWAQYRDNSLHKYLEYTDKGVIISKSIESDLDGSQNINDEWIKVKQRAKKMAATVDGQIPESKKIEAQRHFILNFFTTHKSWLAISLQNRFKGLNPNSESGQLEMGTYNAVFHTLREMLAEYKDGTKGIIQIYKNVRKNPKFQNKLIGDRILSKEDFKTDMKGKISNTVLNMMSDGFNMDSVRLAIISDIANLSNEEQLKIKDSYDRVVATESLKDEATNLVTFMEKRLLVDSAMYIAISALYLLLQGAADDDELKRNSPAIHTLANFSAYLAQRSTNETGGVQLLGNVKGVLETAKSPFVGYSQIKNIVVNMDNMFSTDIVKSGVYKGDTEMSKYWLKDVAPFYGEIKKLGNLEETRKGYKSYNESLADKLVKVFSEDKK